MIDAPLRPILEQARRPRVTAHHLARPDVWRRIAARQSGSGSTTGISPSDDVAEPVEQVVLVADVAIERHGVDPERLAEAPHAQALEARLVGSIDCRVRIRARVSGTRGSGAPRYPLDLGLRDLGLDKSTP